MDVVDLYATGGKSSLIPGKSIVNNNFFVLCHSLTEKASIPKIVKTGLVLFLRRLVDKFAINESNSILSDRTFLVNVLKILKANAIMNGRNYCTVEDLRVLSLVTTFRLPEEVHEQVPQLIEIIISELLGDDEGTGDGSPPNESGQGPTPDDKAEIKKASANQNNSMSDSKFDSGVNDEDSTKSEEESKADLSHGTGHSSNRGHCAHTKDSSVEDTNKPSQHVFSEEFNIIYMIKKSVNN